MKISHHVYALKHTFYIPLSAEKKVERFVYSFVLVGREGIYLIDSGVSASYEAIVSCVQENGRSLTEVKMLLLTHTHPDHIGSAARIKETTGCKVYVHPAERAWIESVEAQYRERPVPGFMSFVGGSCVVDYLLEDAMRIVLEEGLTICVIHTPGHSLGSVSFWIEEDRVLLTGDAVIVPQNFPIYDDPQKVVHSLRKLKTYKDSVWMLSSWDTPRKGSEAQDVYDAGINLVNTIHALVCSQPEGAAMSSEERCVYVLKTLQYPDGIANPLIARSFDAHLSFRDKERL